MSYSEDEHGGGGAHAGAEGSGEQPKKKARGANIAPSKREAQYPADFFQKGDAMWCIACQHAVDHRQSVSAKFHLKGAKHVNHKNVRLAWRHGAS